MEPITPQFILVAVACGVGTCVAVYLAGLHNRRDSEFAFQDTEQEGTDMDGTQLTFEDAIQQRNAVLDGVADTNAGWLKRAADAMARLPDGTVDTGEGFRKRLVEGGLSPPAHRNAWGTLAMHMSRRGYLVKTGERRPMLDPKAHGRATDVYVKRTPQTEAA
jgi:hypothetical protein